VADELRPHHDDLGACILDDLQHLGWGQPPVHRDVDGPELGQSVGDFEKFGAILLDECNPVTGYDTGSLERVGDLARTGVEFGERNGAIANVQRDGVGTFGAVHANDVGQAGDICGRHGPSQHGRGFRAGRFVVS